MNKAIGLALVLTALASTAMADLVIMVGDYDLLPGTAGQEVQIFVTGGDEVQGMNFYVQIADGGPGVADAGFIPQPGILGPTITKLDVITGTPFDGKHTGSLAEIPALQFALDSITTAAQIVDPETQITETSLVAMDGLLATITIDTTGFDTIGQSWELRLANTLGGDFVETTEFIDAENNILQPNITNGSIRIVAPVLTSSGSGSWGDTETWGDGTVTPDAGYAVVIGDSQVIAVTEDASAYSLAISDPSASVAIAAGQTLSLVEDLNLTEGTLQLTSTGAVSAGGDLTVAADSQVVTEIDATTAGLIAVEGDAQLAGTLTFAVSGTSPFLAGTYTLITAGGTTGIAGTFDQSQGLGQYVSIGDMNDGLTYSAESLTVTIDFDLHSGDANLDTVTDVRDFNTWNTNKFTSGTDWSSGDFNGDGTTDVRDFNQWNTAKFTGVGDVGAPLATGQVPEPTTLVLLVCALAAAMAWRRSRS